MGSNSDSEKMKHLFAIEVDSDEDVSAYRIMLVLGSAIIDAMRDDAFSAKQIEHLGSYQNEHSNDLPRSSKS